MLKLMLIARTVFQIATQNRNTKYCDCEQTVIRCKYTDGRCSNNGSGCLIGQAIAKAQPELEPALAEIDKLGTTDVNGLANCLGVNLLEEVDCWLRVDERQARAKEIIKMLGAIQAQQDNGKTWIEAAAFGRGFASANGYSWIGQIL